MNKTVFVCGFSQESNSFNPTLTELEVFRGYEIFEGGEAPEKPVCLPDANGMLEFFKEAGVEINDKFEALLAGGCIEEHIFDTKEEVETEVEIKAEDFGKMKINFDEVEEVFTVPLSFFLSNEPNVYCLDDTEPLFFFR